LGVLAVIGGLACDVTGAVGAVGGVVVVAVAVGADLTTGVPACSLARATAPMTTTALAAITADSSLTLMRWPTSTTPFGPGWSADLDESLPQGSKAHGTHAPTPRKELRSYASHP
jgi:hypothetical protein